MSRSNQLAGLITATPTSTLDTINEINTSLNNDANLSTTLTNSIATKMPLAGGAFTGNITIPNGGTIGSAGDADAITIASTGKINTTSANAGTAFEIENTNGSTNYGLFIKGGTSSSNAHYALGINNSADSPIFRVMGNGNVGIGTISVTHTFEALSTNTASFLLDRNSGSNAGSLSEYNTFYALSIKNRTNGSYLRFGGGGSRAEIQATDGAGTPTAKDIIFNPYGGNVGIGTTSPATDVEIRGSGNTVVNSKGNLFISDGGTASQSAGEGGQISFGAWLNGDLSAPYLMASIKGISESSTTHTNTGALIFATKTQTNCVERMRIESGGNTGTYGDITSGSPNVGLSGDIYHNTVMRSYGYIDGSTSQHEWLNRNMQNVGGNGTGGAWCQIRASQASYQTTMHMWFYRQWTGEEEFRFPYTGNATAEGGWYTGSLDFAELFEWADGNTENEDRVGLPVVNVEDKIRVATNEDQPADIIGCISGVAGFVGNSATLHWKDKFVTDDYGRVVEEDAHAFIWTDNEGEERQYAYDEIPEGITVPEDAERVEGKRKKVNPDFDPNVEYIPREERKEWATVGLLGQVPVKKGSPVNPNWIKLKECSTQSDWYLIR